MKIGIISDLHGNLTALRAVLQALDEAGCVKVLCGGDIVGYGPRPLECLELLEQRKILSVRGNHDHMMLNTERDRFIRQDVRDAVCWTRETLPEDARQHVANLPMSLRYAGIEIVHASHVFKPDWHYVIDNHSVMANFLFQHASVAFNGHTHLPLVALHQRGSQPRLLMLRSMKLPPRHKFMINVGSVGQPRDRNPEASFVLYETKDRSVELHRIPYDVEETQKQMREARLPLSLITRLSEGR